MIGGEEINGGGLNGLSGGSAFPFPIDGNETLQVPKPVFQQGLPTRGEDICGGTSRRTYTARAPRSTITAKRRHTC